MDGWIDEWIESYRLNIWSFSSLALWYRNGHHYANWEGEDGEKPERGGGGDYGGDGGDDGDDDDSFRRRFRLTWNASPSVILEIKSNQINSSAIRRRKKKEEERRYILLFL